MDSEVLIPGYYLIRYDKSTQGWCSYIYFGYVLILCNCYWPKHSNLSISINHPSTKIGLAVLYRPPSSPVHFLTACSEALNIPMYFNYLLIGDLNFDISTSNSLHTQLWSILTHGHFHRTYSCDQQFWVYYRCCTQPNLFALINVLATVPPLGSSDHFGLFASIDLLGPRPKPNNPRMIWRYNHGNFSLANDLLCELDPDSFIVEGDPNATGGTRSWR